MTIKKSSGDAAKVAKQFDDAWMYTLLMVIGDTLSSCGEITGVVAAPRAKEYRLAVWTRDGSTESVVMEIGKQWKQVLGVNDRIEYALHYGGSKSPVFTA